MIKAKVKKGTVKVKMYGSGIDVISELCTLCVSVIRNISKETGMNKDDLTRSFCRTLTNVINKSY